MVPRITEILSAAITSRRRIAIRYKNQAQIRVVEPHVLYRSRSGRGIVESYQVRGHSSGGRVPPFWRPFQIKKIASVDVLEEVFEPRISEGFEAIRKLISGDILCVIDAAPNEYSYLNPSIYGPPKPEDWGDATRRLQRYV
jgi:hypothetical protein